MSDRQIGQLAKELMIAKARIANPDNWCTKTFAGENGRRCAVGALMPDDAYSTEEANKAIHERLAPIENNIRALKESSFALYGTCNIYGINDDWGHEHVMAVYDHAINRAISERM